ncbi:MAG: BamA/TamA family outer membrane protein [Planctomycetes bacterium]|nr:BamA/TamA family outer membrane protein [Planctomycetota bacterium]
MPVSTRMLNFMASSVVCVGLLLAVRHEVRAQGGYGTPFQPPAGYGGQGQGYGGSGYGMPGQNQPASAVGDLPPTSYAPNEPSLRDRQGLGGNSASSQATETPDDGRPSVGPIVPPTSDSAVPRRDETVADVRVFGNHGVPIIKITPHIKTRAGRPYDPHQVSDDVRRLLQTRAFVTVDIKYQRTPEGGLIIIYQVVERPTLRYVRYVGNKVKERHLIKQSGLSAGDALDPYMVTEARKKIEEYYHNKGYTRARVTIVEGDKAGDRGAIFLINEGEKQRIWDVEFEGNQIATDARLKTQIKSKKPLLWIFKGELDRQKIDEDVDRLKTYYRGLGFFKARIGRELEFNDKHNWVTIRYVIDEGPRFKVNNVSLVGNTKFSLDDLNKDLRLKAGNYFDQGTMTGDIFAVKDKYGHIGYIYSDVEPELRFLEEPGTLDLVYHLEEGARYRIGRIEVRIHGDNPRTRRHTVMNRVSVRPGQIADIRMLRDSERRLKGSGLFMNKPAEGIEPKLTWGKPMDDMGGGGPGGQDGSASNNGPNGTGGPGGRTAHGGRGGYRGQSPDDDEEVWRPEPGCTDKVINVVVDGVWFDEPETVKGPVIVRAQSPQQGAFDDFSRRPMAASTAPATNNQGYPSSPYTAAAPTANAVQPAAYNQPYQAAPAYAQAPAPQRTNIPQGYPAAPTAAPAYQPPTNQLPAYQPPTATQAVYQAPMAGPANPYGSSAPTNATSTAVYAPAGQVPMGRTDPTAVQSAYSPAVQQVQYQQPGSNLAPTPYTGSAPVAPPPGYDTPGQLNPDGARNPIFGPVAPNPYQEQDQEVPVFIDVTEAQTGRVMVGAGVNSSSGLVGQITLDEQNFDIRRVPTSWEDIRSGTAFRGAGQQLRIQAMPGTQLSYYTATFREPYFLDTLVSFSLSGQFFNRYFQYWSEQRGGGTMGLGYQFTPDLQGQMKLRAESITVYNPTSPTPPELAAVLGTSELYTLRWDLIHDTRDSPFLPTQGHYINFAYEQAFAQFVYPRFTIDARQHFLLKQRADRSGRQTLTFMTNMGFTGDNTPMYENFFAGGYQTLRGFYFRGASPTDLGVQVGGKFMWVNTVEYMFPITSDDMIRGVAFCDFGTVEPTTEIRRSDFRVSPGLGLRLTIPAMGPAPIAVDFAAPITYMQGDMIQNVSFFVGAMR